MPEDLDLGRVIGIGMNRNELEQNPRLTEFRVKDLNVEPNLSEIESQTLDAVLITVSVDYLIKVWSVN